VIAVDAHQGAEPAHGGTGRQRRHRAGELPGRALIVASYVEDAHGVARIHERDGRLVGAVPLPGMGGIDGFQGEGSRRETFFSYTDYLTPRRVYRLDVATNQATLWREPQVPGSMTDFITEQVFYNSKDGTRVPMYITHRRDMAKDGNTPLLLYGYGGFNISAPRPTAPRCRRAGNGGRVCRGEPARWRGVRRGLAQGRHACEQAARVR
jgi:dipeptidyl aminopeptidase/acylaminoacyl peptidase